MVRKDGRGAEEPREAKISHNIQEYAEGSVLIEVGATKIICAVIAPLHMQLLDSHAS